MARNFLKDLFDPICFSQSQKRFERLQNSLKTPSTRLALPFAYRGEGHYRKIAPMQAHEEIAALYNSVCAKKPAVVLEIGTCHGGSLYLWTQAAADNATIISLDLPGGEYGGGYHPKREKLYKLFAKPTQQLHLLRGNSHEEQSLEAVKKILNGRSVDFLFIDGDHSYEGVKKDFELYSPLLSDGGMIALHDIAPRKAEDGIEVDKFWNELKPQEFNTQEFINTDPADRTLGIGLVHR